MQETVSFPIILTIDWFFVLFIQNYWTTLMTKKEGMKEVRLFEVLHSMFCQNEKLSLR